MTATDFPALITLLSAGGVEFIVIGGIAAGIHGSAHVTFDLDVVYRRTPENFGKIADALAPLHPYLRDAPEGLPFTLDVATIGGHPFLCVSLRRLIGLKRAAGRPKDLSVLAELEALLEEREREL